MKIFESHFLTFLHPIRFQEFENKVFKKLPYLSVCVTKSGGIIEKKFISCFKMCILTILFHLQHIVFKNQIYYYNLQFDRFKYLQLKLLLKVVIERHGKE